MKKRIALILVVVLLCCFGLAACKARDEGEKNEEREELTKVTLNEVAHSIFYAPQYVAIEEGYFVEEGIKLELVTGFGADKVMAAVLSGDADIGFMGSESSIYAYQQGANDKVVNFAQLTQRAGNFLVSREKMPEFQWEDLKGKDILGGRKGGVWGIVTLHQENTHKVNGGGNAITLNMGGSCSCNIFSLCTL